MKGIGLQDGIIQLIIIFDIINEKCRLLVK